MVMLNISEALAAKLDAYAKREGRSIEDILETLITEYSRIPPDERNIEEQSAAMESIGGLFDDDVTDTFTDRR
jgi:Ribbon-helix-helix protein, copG family